MLSKNKRLNCNLPIQHQQGGLNKKLYNYTIPDLFDAIWKVEMKEEKPTVDPKDFDLKQQILYGNVLSEVSFPMWNGVDGYAENNLPSLSDRYCNRGILKQDVLLYPQANGNSGFLSRDKPNWEDRSWTELDVESPCSYVPSYTDSEGEYWMNKLSVDDINIAGNASDRNQLKLDDGLDSTTQGESSEEDSSGYPSSPGEDTFQINNLISRPGDRHPHPRRRRLRRSQGIRKPKKLWEYILMMLMSPGSKNCVKWVDEASGEFIIKDSKMLAKSWGIHKCQQPTTYDNVSRSLRYYYGEKILAKVKHRRLMYKFVIRDQYRKSKLKFLRQSCELNGDNF